MLTGFDGGDDRENYFAKRTDHPGMGAVCGHLGLGRSDLPSYVTMPACPVERPIDPQNLMATLYRHLGIDLHTHFPDGSGRPVVITTGTPIKELG